MKTKYNYDYYNDVPVIEKEDPAQLNLEENNNQNTVYNNLSIQPSLLDIVWQKAFLFSSVIEQLIGGTTHDYNFQSSRRKKLDLAAQDTGSPISGVNKQLDEEGIDLTESELEAFLKQIQTLKNPNYLVSERRIRDIHDESKIRAALSNTVDECYTSARNLQSLGLFSPKHAEAHKQAIATAKAGASMHKLYQTAKSVAIPFDHYGPCEGTSMDDLAELFSDDSHKP